MNSDISLKALRYFVTAISEGSITEAAKVVNVVPSAVHTAINQVEAAFGLQLTIRSRSKGISLTATGHQMLPKIQNLLDEYESLLREGNDMRTRLTGTLRVGYYAPAAPSFMPKIIEETLRDNNEVSVKFFECDSQSAQDGLVSGAFDVIICVAQAMKPGIAYETLLELPGYALVPASDPLAARASITMREFADRPLVLLDLPVISEYYASQFNQVGVKPDVVATANSLEMVRSLVGRGIGCSLLHMLTANQFTYAGDKVAAVPLEPQIDSLKIVLGHLPDTPRRLVRVFVDELQTYFNKAEARALRVAEPKS